MSGCIDQITDSKEPKDLSTEEPRKEFVTELGGLTAAENSSIHEHYHNAANNDSTRLHDLELKSKPPFDSGSSEEHRSKLRDALSQRAKELRAGQPTPLSDIEKAIRDDGTITTADGGPITKEMQEQFTRTLELQEAARLENLAILDGSGGVLERAIDRLVETAGTDLPPDFEEQMTDFLHRQFRQRAGNDESVALGWKDIDGNPLVFPCAGYDEDSTADEKMAALFDFFHQRLIFIIQHRVDCHLYLSAKGYRFIITGALSKLSV